MAVGKHNFEYHFGKVVVGYIGINGLTDLGAGLSLGQLHFFHSTAILCHNTEPISFL
jgi:hypothetical protein